MIFFCQLATRVQPDFIQHPGEIHHSLGHFLRAFRISAHRSTLNCSSVVLATPAGNASRSAAGERLPTCRLSLVAGLTTLPAMECPFTTPKEPAYYGSYLAVDKLLALQ